MSDLSTIELYVTVSTRRLKMRLDNDESTKIYNY